MLAVSSWIRPLTRRLGWAFGLGIFALALGEAATDRQSLDDEPPPIRRRVLITGLTALSALAVGVSWGRWLEGAKDSDDEPPPSDPPAD